MGHAIIAAAAAVLVPEPGSIGVLGAGLAGIAFMRHRRRGAKGPLNDNRCNQGRRWFDSVIPLALRRFLSGAVTISGTSSATGFFRLGGRL